MAVVDVLTAAAAVIVGMTLPIAALRLVVAWRAARATRLAMAAKARRSSRRVHPQRRISLEWVAGSIGTRPPAEPATTSGGQALNQCRRCGHVNKPGTLHCRRCGAGLLIS
jgi:hypothetical protein